MVYWILKKGGKYLLYLSLYSLHGILRPSVSSEAANQVVYQMLRKVTYKIVLPAGHQPEQVAHSQDKKVFKISVW